MFFKTYSFKEWFVDYEFNFIKGRFNLFITQENNIFEKVIFVGNTPEIVFNLFTSWFHSVVETGEVIHLIQRGFPIYIEENILFGANDKPFGFALTYSDVKDKKDVLRKSAIPSYLKKDGYIFMTQLQNFLLLEPHLVEDSKLFAINFNPRMATLHAQTIRMKEIFSKHTPNQIKEEYFSYSVNYMDYALNPFLDKNHFDLYPLDEVYIEHRKSISDILYLGEWKKGTFIPSVKFDTFVKPRFKALMNSIY